MEAAAHLRAPAVLRAWQAILVVGVAVLAISYLGHLLAGWDASVRDLDLRGTGAPRSIRLPCARRSRARGAPRLVLHRLRPARHDDRRRPLRLLVRRQSALPVCRRRRVSPLLPAALRRDRPLAPPAGLAFSATLWLDGLVAATAAAALGASVLVEVVVNSTHGSRLVVLTNMAYPIGDVLLLALLVFVFSVTRWRPGRAWALIAAGLILNTVGDGLYLYQTAVGTYRRARISTSCGRCRSSSLRSRPGSGPGASRVSSSSSVRFSARRSCAGSPRPECSLQRPSGRKARSRSFSPARRSRSSWPGPR